jgi:hypothetical protein
MKINISHCMTYNSNLPDKCNWFLSHCMAVTDIGFDHLSKGLFGSLKQIKRSQ